MLEKLAYLIRKLKKLNVYISTVGFNNLNKTVQLSDGSLINCCLLDTAGQERKI